jgi:predicted glycosyltransferase
VPHLSALFGSLDALVCMGGYNTLVEATALGVPTVCVPRVTPRTEQLIRAEAFARLGLLRVCRPEVLNPQTLGDHIAVALNSSPQDLKTRAHTALNFDGAQQAAKHLLALATESAPAELDTAILQPLTVR